jgi:hypothetical protein
MIFIVVNPLTYQIVISADELTLLTFDTLLNLLSRFCILCVQMPWHRITVDVLEECSHCRKVTGCLLDSWSLIPGKIWRLQLTSDLYVMSGL